MKRSNLYLLIFSILQVVIFIIYSTQGRDNDEYNRIFSSRSILYLEPFWILFGDILDATKLSGILSYSDALCLFLIVLSIAFFKISAPRIQGNIGLSLLTILVLSYQISFVTGALRQGISVLAFSLFLLIRSKPTFAISIITHNSGLIYSFFNIKLAAFLVATFASLLALRFVDLGFVSYAASRFQSYLGVEQDTFITKILPVFISKGILIFGIVINFNFIKKIIKNRYLSISLLAAPILQILVVIFISSPIVVDRGNMVLDPFIIVGTTILCMKMNSINTLLVALMVLPKFLVRLTLAF